MTTGKEAASIKTSTVDAKTAQAEAKATAVEAETLRVALEEERLETAKKAIKTRSNRATMQAAEDGARELEVRVRFSLLATTLNIRAQDPKWERKPNLDDTLDNASALIKLLELPLFDKPFLGLIRQAVAVMYAALPHDAHALRVAADYIKARDDRDASKTPKDEPEFETLDAKAEAAFKTFAAVIAKQPVFVGEPATTPPWRSWFEAAKASKEPRTCYNLACLYASIGDKDEALRRLKYAVREPTLKASAGKDPALKTLHNNAEFKKLVRGVPRKSAWELAPFTASKAKLKAIGVEEFAELSKKRNVAERYRLMNYLNLQSPELDYMLDSASLAAAVVAASRTEDKGKKDKIGDLNVELISQLRSHEIRKPSDLKAWYTAKGTLSTTAKLEEVVESLKEEFGSKLTLARATRWLTAVKDWEPKE